MRFLHTADLHLGTKLGIGDGENFRVKDFLKALDFVVNTAIREQVNYLLFVGDAFKSFDPSNTLLTEFVKRVKKLADNDIHFIYIKGNHDDPKTTYKHHSLAVLRELDLPRVLICDKPEVFQFGSLFQLVAIPFLLEAYRSDFRQFFNNTLQDLISQVKKDVPVILALHYYVDGTVLSNNYSGGGTIGRGFIDAYPWSYVALGDIHKSQIISKVPLAVYPGSLERVTFGERNEEKSFVVFDLKEGRVEDFRAIMVPTRPMYRVKQSELKEGGLPDGSIVEIEMEGDSGENLLKEILKKFAYVSLLPKRRVIEGVIDKIENIDFLSEEYLLDAAQKTFPEEPRINIERMIMVLLKFMKEGALELSKKAGDI